MGKQVADGNPVGEAQNDPNHDPYLEKPTLGRDLGALFEGVGEFKLFNMFLAFFSKKFLYYIMGLFGSLIVTMILFVKPGILV